MTVSVIGTQWESGNVVAVDSAHTADKGVFQQAHSVKIFIRKPAFLLSCEQILSIQQRHTSRPLAVKGGLRNPSKATTFVSRQDGLQIRSVLYICKVTYRIAIAIIFSTIYSITRELHEYE